MSTYYGDIYKDLIGESTKQEFLVKPYIEFMKFDPEEILQYKDQDEIHIIRPINELNKFNIGIYVKPEWGKVYKIEDKQLLNDITDWKYFNTLNKNQIEYLSKANTEMYVALTLVRVVKKDTRRIFYDFEFDESPDFGIIPISIGMIDEDGNELILVNNEFDWSECSNKWLFKNVKPYIDEMPDYLKVSKETIKNKVLEFIKPSPTKEIKLYGYYSAYDHVCLCQLFGKMINLPKGLPMYTIDLKQYMDYFNVTKGDLGITENNDEHNALSDAKWNKQLFDALKNKFANKYI